MCSESKTPSQPLFPMTPAQFVEHLTTRSPRIYLPTIQRDAVWRSRQICELWDSLMRGIPIPSLVLQKVSEADERTGARAVGGGVVSDENQASVSTHDFWLLDGQQRANAIRIGFRETNMHRLWLDLGWKPGEHGRCFGFFLCSAAHPWGDARDLNGRPGAGGVRDARKDVGINNGCFDFEIELDKTWPVAATAPIPFAPLLQWAITETLTKDTLIAKVGEIAETLPESVRKKLGEKCSLLKILGWEALLAGLQRVAIPLIIAVEASMDPDDLLKAFTRLNRNGTRLTDSELFFSALKKEMPQSQDLVSRTCQDRRRAFGELEVLRAFTVLATENTELTQAINGTALNLELFKTINKQGREPFQARLASYLASTEATNAIVLLNRTIDTLLYTEGQDKGLPAVMLPRLHVRTWLPVLHWLNIWSRTEVSSNNRDKALNRNKALRFVLADHFFADWNAGEDKPLRELLRLVGQSPNFPMLHEIESHLGAFITRSNQSGWLKHMDFPQSGEKGSLTVPCPLSTGCSSANTLI